MHNIYTAYISPLFFSAEMFEFRRDIAALPTTRPAQPGTPTEDLVTGPLQSSAPR